MYLPVILFQPRSWALIFIPLHYLLKMLLINNTSDFTTTHLLVMYQGTELGLPKDRAGPIFSVCLSLSTFPIQVFTVVDNFIWFHLSVVNIFYLSHFPSQAISLSLLLYVSVPPSPTRSHPEAVSIKNHVNLYGTTFLFVNRPKLISHTTKIIITGSCEKYFDLKTPPSLILSLSLSAPSLSLSLSSYSVGKPIFYILFISPRW